MKRFLPILVFLTIALVGITLAGFAYLARQEADRIRLESIVDSGYNRIESRIVLNLSVLRAARAFFEARGGEVSSREFREFFEALEIDENFAGLRGIGYLGVFRPEEIAAASQFIQRHHGQEGGIYPDSAQELRTPVLLYEPLDANGPIGFDMFTDPVRREAIRAALADSTAHASGRVLLHEQPDGGQSWPGFLVFLRTELGSGNGQRQAGGVLYAAFRSQELFQAALQRRPLLPLALEVHDEHNNPDRLLFRSNAPPADKGHGGLIDIRSMTVGERNLVLTFRPTSSFDARALHVDLILLILFSLLLASAMALAIRYRERAYAAAAHLHGATEKSLQERDLMLQEMKHRNKNQITRILAIARQTASGSESIEDFSASFTARLQSMSNSLDLLTRSRWQRAELSELLRSELHQVFGSELPEGLLSGPRVELDATATQALGLTFHELATNALKYGKAGEAVDTLQVSWRIEAQDKQRILVLNWQESGVDGLRSPDSTGFGTRLIEMSITKELNGTIDRNFRPEGLEVEIRFAL